MSKICLPYCPHCNMGNMGRTTGGCVNILPWFNFDKRQDSGNLVASCHIGQTSQTRNGYKWFMFPGCLLDGWTDRRTKATEPWLHHHHHHPMSVCVCVYVWVGGRVGGNATHSAHPSGSLGEWQSNICIGKKNVTRLDLNFVLPDSNPAHIFCVFCCFSKLSRANISLAHITTNKTLSTLIQHDMREEQWHTYCGQIPKSVSPSWWDEARCIMYISAWCKQQLAAELLMHYSRLYYELTQLQWNGPF